MLENRIKQAAEIINGSQYTTAFSGAGISVESGIPPFRGQNGLWEKYDPAVLDLDRFYHNPAGSWAVIKELFYDFFGAARPNAAHKVLARMEQAGLLNDIITQNIDNLHQEAGSQTVWEFHGSSRNLVCIKCHTRYASSTISFAELPPRCNCGGLLKPDFIFFGEKIPPLAYEKSIEAANKSDVFLVIGTTGEIMPASLIPARAKARGAKIIEINTEPSTFTHRLTDIYLPGKATAVFAGLASELGI